ncbi:MAG: hypothetical protein A3J38_05325 [Gammaproteobacteria bacterium RIFCSPHIGHO2_12_FULL_45_9]|nr:MAG: hypothetical protein A3J38_05325 [Gammaproteobacteria bacterium RIFCSPHIGHO2_12_FULL_45_9]
MKVNFTAQEREHYRRHFNLPEVGEEGQKRLKQARVLYIGAGGLGSAALPYLVAAGVGVIGIVDDDHVEISNLQRQVLYSYQAVGQKKVEAAAARLQELNPAVQIVMHDMRLSRANALALISQYDVVADGSDNFATRYLVNDACFHLKKPYVYASISQFAGQCAVFAAEHSACLRCLFPAPPPATLLPNCAEGGVMGVLPGILGSIQAMEVMKLILGIGKPLVNRLLQLDALTMAFRELTVTPDPACILCCEQQAFTTLPYHDDNVCGNDSMNLSNTTEISVAVFEIWRQQGHDFILLDVREQSEYLAGNLGGVLIPLGELPMRLSELDKAKQIVVHCQHGFRSQQAMVLLHQHGFQQVCHLQGGFSAWMNYHAVTQ